MLSHKNTGFQNRKSRFFNQFLSISFVLLLAGLINVVGAQGKLEFNEKYAADELLVKLRTGAPLEKLRVLNAETGGVISKQFAESGWQLIKLPRGANLKQAIELYKKINDTVESAQPNYIYKIVAAPNDARFAELYGMQKIGAPAAWNTTVGDGSAVVAIIDTGVRYTHEDIAANMWRNAGETPGNNLDDDANGYVDDYYGYDFINRDSDPTDDHDHGTHVAGTIGGVANNGVGVAGVCWNVRMMALKIFDETGHTTTAQVLEAFSYIRMMKQRGVNIRVTNNSYGGPPEVAAEDLAMKNAIDLTGEADILNVFAVGNDYRDIDASTPFYPAGFNSPSILSVAASDSSDNKADFSNSGALSVDLAAPGDLILSAIIATDSSYESYSGTSMATPHVAGAAALLSMANPQLSAASLKATLMNTVDVLPQWSNLVKTGGRLNVSSALANQSVCSFDLSSASSNLYGTSGNSSFNVTAGQNCDYAAYSNASWLTVNSNPGSGNGTVTFAVEANPTLSPRTAQLRIAGQTFTVTQSALAPTAASVTITGRVLSSEGRAVRNAQITLVDGAGNSRTAISNPFGYYRFTEISAGQTVTIEAFAKGYSFTPKVLTLHENATDLNFTAEF